MSAFWDDYPAFVHRTNVPLKQEFGRLASQLHWSKQQKRVQWLRCAQEEFKHHFGRDEKGLAGWQAMCALVEVHEIPDSVAGCKRLLKDNIWVNIFDLLDAQRMGKLAKRHDSARALGKYCRDTRRIFPKHEAKANPFLRVLLVEVF
ncbi:hypothetical protein R3P38DRAFT_3211624 [Favolaschia claudopus]|uniref:Uncharacterized protein n=1 Tax=Favolaschia claudopus TaxID=2862362 RepID=A0AAW0AHN6_9AGAR